jgi:hypothetical protein
MIRELERQVAKRLRALEEGSMAHSFCNENKGRLRRVDGTQSEMAWGMRAEVYAAWGRMSTMRAEESLSQASISAGFIGGKTGGTDDSGCRVGGAAVMGDWDESRAVKMLAEWPNLSAMA